MKTASIERILLDIYANTKDAVANDHVYNEVQKAVGVQAEIKPVGKSKTQRNLLHRKIRWAQQNLKLDGSIRSIKRGHWQLTGKKNIELHSIEAANHMVAMSTSLGVAIWAKSSTIFDSNILEDEIHAIITSPPYPLKVQRAYGEHMSTTKYIEFILESFEPLVAKLAKGGNIAINLSQDIFEDCSPARSDYLERLVIKFKDELGLSLMDRIPWTCTNKPPGPYQWASKNRYQLHTGYEPIYWFTNDPLACISNNQRILEPHSEQHLKFVRSGGTKKHAVNGDGAYVKKVGSYSKETAGKIPQNVFNFSNYCKEGRAVSAYAKTLGIPAHAAKMPLPLAEKLVKFLSQEGDLICDPFGGTLTTGHAAEIHGRRWICTDMIWEYIRSSFVRFDDKVINPRFLSAPWRGKKALSY
jgi:site-specific DNA-methyltransferase (cytosine-N4-specific)